MQGVLKRINAKTLIVDFIALLSVLIIQWLTHYHATSVPHHFVIWVTLLSR